jgi:hypothetical protein
VTATATPDAKVGDLAGVLVLTRDGVRRRVPVWGRVTRPTLGTAVATRLVRPGVYEATTRGRPTLVRTYRYPDRAPGLRATMAGPERVYRVRLTRPVANFGVAVTRRAAGVTVQPRIVAAADENRLTGWPGLPVALNPYLETYGSVVLAAGAIRPAPGAYDVVFDSPTAGGAGAFSFRLWIDDTTPPRSRLLVRSIDRGTALRVAVSDAGAGVDPGALSAAIDGATVKTGLRDGIVRIGTAGLARGRHHLRLQVSDYQESRNNENVPAILPNTRVLETTFVVRTPA